MLEITPKQLELKKILSWIGLILVLLSVGIYLLNSKISVLAKNIQDKKSQIQALKYREENITHLQENYYKIEKDIPTVTAILPDEKNVADFVKYLEDLANTHNANIELVFNDKLNAKINENNYLIFNLMISGSSVSCQNYWKDLEDGPYFANVTAFTFSTTSGFGSDSQLKLTTKVFTNKPFRSP